MKEWLTGYIPRSAANEAASVSIMTEHDTEQEARELAQRRATDDADQQVVLRVVCATAPRLAELPLYTPDHPALQ